MIFCLLKTYIVAFMSNLRVLSYTYIIELIPSYVGLFVVFCIPFAADG